MTITKTLTVSLAIAIFSGFGSMAFATGGGGAVTAKETAAAALKFVNEQLGERPVVAVVYSHSHADHFGGVRGVVDEADVRSGKVKIIAPVGFMDHAVSASVYAGNAMSRRSPPALCAQ